jgi:hypothetical protein
MLQDWDENYEIEPSYCPSCEESWDCNDETTCPMCGGALV